MTRAVELPERMLRLTEVQQLVPFSKMHIDRLEKAGRFPRRVKIGSRRVAWPKAAVLAWLAERAAASGRPVG